MSDLSERVRAAISDAYYDARNDGLTMEHAANEATAKVLAIISEIRPPEEDDVLILVTRAEPDG